MASFTPCSQNAQHPHAWHVPHHVHRMHVKGCCFFSIFPNTSTLLEQRYLDFSLVLGCQIRNSFWQSLWHVSSCNFFFFLAMNWFFGLPTCVDVGYGICISPVIASDCSDFQLRKLNPRAEELTLDLSNNKHACNQCQAEIGLRASFFFFFFLCSHNAAMIFDILYFDKCCVRRSSSSFREPWIVLMGSILSRKRSRFGLKKW